MARGGKAAARNDRRKIQREERRKKRQRSEEPGVCPPSRPPSPFPDLCYVDTTPEAVEGAGAANDVTDHERGAADGRYNLRTN